MMKVFNSARAVLMISVALALAAVPVHVEWKAGTSALKLASVDAKNGKGGGHGGGGNGGSSSRGGKGSESKDGKGQNGSSGKAKGRAASVANKEVTPNSVAVRYRNGYLEQVVKGRFIMKDSKGRTIVNREATARDRMRLFMKKIVP